MDQLDSLINEAENVVRQPSGKKDTLRTLSIDDKNLSNDYGMFTDLAN